AAMNAVREAVTAITPGSDYTVMYYFDAEGGARWEFRGGNITRERLFETLFEQLKVGKLREYQRIICFDNDVLANHQELKSGILRVGEGPGTIDRLMGEHGRKMMETKGCSLYVAPAVLRLVVALFGTDKVSINVETARDTGGRTITAV